MTTEAVANGAQLDAVKSEMKSILGGFEDSIPLSWSNVPAGTRSIDVVMHHFANGNETDPSKANQYLPLWDIDPSATEIAYGAWDAGLCFTAMNKDNVISYTSPGAPDGLSWINDTQTKGRLLQWS